MGIYMTQAEAEKLITSKDESSSNKLMTTRGIGFIYGEPATRKTTIAIDTVKNIDDLNEKIYIDLDSKSKNQITETYTNLSDIGWKYVSSLINRESIDDIISNVCENIQEDSCIIVDTWHQILGDENDNKMAKAYMRKLREFVIKKNLLIVLIAHTGKYSEDIRGASSVSGDVTFKVLIEKTDRTNEFSCSIRKDSLGLLESTTAIFRQSNSITRSKIEYTSEIKGDSNKMKPKEYALQTAMEGLIVEQLETFNNNVPISDFRILMVEEVNNYNDVSPTSDVFITPNFIKLNFVAFCESIFIIRKNGRQKYITGLKIKDVK